MPLSDLRPGDLIFFGNASFSHHVAIFVGGTTCIEAPHTGDVVRYGTFTGRVTTVPPGMIEMPRKQAERLLPDNCH